MQSNIETDFQRISKIVMATYQEQMHEYLNSKPEGTLTDADVILMIMNLTIGIGTNVYYSLKQILPNTPMDFDFMKVKMVNSFIDAFEKIKDFTPKETMIALTVDQVKEIREKGSTIITLADGTNKTITVEDIMVKRDDADKLLKEAKKDAVKIVPSNTKKIITNSGRSFRR